MMMCWKSRVFDGAKVNERPHQQCTSIGSVIASAKLQVFVKITSNHLRCAYSSSLL